MRDKNLSELSCTLLKGVGSKVADALARLDIHTVQGVLFHLPLRYEDRTRLSPVRSLRVGDYACVQGQVVYTEVTYKKRRMLWVHLEDNGSLLTLCFFNFTQYQQRKFQVGTHWRCYGKVILGARGVQMTHPEYQSAWDDKIAMNPTLTAIYPTVSGISQLMWRKLVVQALRYLKDYPLAPALPESIESELNYNLVGALEYVHCPPPEADLRALNAGEHPAQQRLAFEELVSYQLGLKLMRQKLRQQEAFLLPKATDRQDIFMSQLGFELTHAQRRAVEEISNDLQRTEPMVRLLQGDVGSGKTVVAGLVALQAIDAGVQVALLAPTELLAEQHYNHFISHFKAMGISVGRLTGSLGVAEKESMLKAIKSGEVSMVIGTHALFQAGVQFARLGFIIIDEQHRFGVSQRAAMKDKGAFDKIPHQLLMTATPIPRTLAMTAYADFDCTTLDELPPNRQPIVTTVVSNERRAEVMSRIKQHCLNRSKGPHSSENLGRGQVYWVCTVIDESERVQAKAAETTSQELVLALAPLRVALVHGRMNADERDRVMEQFSEGLIDVLVATTVIEVGLDVSNASLMVIENSERLGLSQLHQLRGRVGRGAQQSHCVLLYQAPLSELARTRLMWMRTCADGFALAEQDLKLRGPGEVLGVRQSGLLKFKVADLKRDAHLIGRAHQLSNRLLQKPYQAYQIQLTKRWFEKYWLHSL